MRAKVTMTEIARLAGVSESTVSRALNDSPLLSEATKAKILTISQERGYAVNATASSLRRQSAGALALVIPIGQEDANRVSDPFFLEMIGAVTQAATDHGYDLIISLPSVKGSISRRRLIASGRADGLIVAGQAGRHEQLNELNDAGVPFVAWGGQLDGQRYVTVGSDNRRGGFLAGEHLLSLGRRRLVFLGDRNLPEVELRYQGFLEAHKVLGLTHDKALYFGAPFQGDKAFNMIDQAVRGGLEFDSVFAASDMEAIAAIRGLTHSGRKVPEDVSVIGYDDLAISSQVSPPLSTISQDISVGGRRLVELMLAKLASQSIHSELTETRLVIRGTTCPLT